MIFTPNPGQGRAIGAPLDRPVRVVAGAGTGKTEVIARRYLHLLREHHLDPENILVLTFSEKAAAEMRARILLAVSRAGVGRTRLDLAGASISTFHSFCARLLADHSLQAGIDPDQPVLSEIESNQVMDELMEEFLDEGFKDAYPTMDPLASESYSWIDGGPAKDAQQAVAQMRNQAVEQGEFESEMQEGKDRSEAYQVLAPLVGWLYARYTRRLEEKGQLDFDRQIFDAALLLERNADLRERFRRDYRVILVDEYQDTNYAQQRLLRVLAADGSANVTVVGDPRQAIYVWREARVENIAGFAKEGGNRFEAPLTENRRSLKPILDLANRAIEGYELGEQAEFDPADQLFPFEGNLDFTPPVVTLQACATRAEEAQAVVDWVRDAAAHGIDYRDIAILIRARTYLSTYTDALNAAGIPFELSAENAFYMRPEILDAVHLLRVCLDPALEVSLVRVLSGPAVGLTQDEIARLRNAGAKHLWAAVLDPAAAELGPEAEERLARLVGFWRSAQRKRRLLAPAAFLDWALLESGLGATHDPVARRALDKLLALAQDYGDAHPADTLSQMADYLMEALKAELPEKAPELNTNSDAVRVLTDHAAKGLEFRVVIAVDSRQKVKPDRDFKPFHEPEVGLIIPRDDEADPHFQERMRRMRNEARSLWYVALTRPKERLVVTATNPDAAEGKELKGKTLFEELWAKENADPTPGVEMGSAPIRSPGEKPPAGLPVSPQEVPAAALRELVRARVAAGKPSFALSPTAFRRYQQCPAGYRFYELTRLGRALELQEGEDRSTGGSLLGTAFHVAAARQGERPLASRDELLDAIPRENWSALTVEQQNLVESWLDLYLQSELGRKPPSARNVEQALGLTLEFDPARLMLNGIADRIEASRLVDYKTDAYGENLSEKHGDQVRLYALAAQRGGILAAGASLYIYHVPTAQMIPVSWNELEEKRLLADLAGFAGALVAPYGAFPSQPGEYCVWCTARGVICSGE